jgi:hypothetical protein
LKKNVSSGTKRNTPLSNTEYFDVSVANLDDKGGRLRTRTAKELPKEGSPYAVTAEWRTYRDHRAPIWIPGDKEYDLMQKSVKVENRFWYRDIDVKIQYQYVITREGDFEDTFGNFQEETGLYISITGVIAGNELTSLEDFAVYDISGAELKERSEKSLENFLNYWVDNYSKSRFNRDDFGQYELVGPEVVEKQRGVFAEQ